MKSFVMVGKGRFTRQQRCNAAAACRSPLPCRAGPQITKLPEDLPPEVTSLIQRLRDFKGAQQWQVGAHRH